MMGHCRLPVKVQQIGTKWVTIETCPAGHPRDLEPVTLYSICLLCPKRQNNSQTFNKPVIKRTPVLRKKL